MTDWGKSMNRVSRSAHILAAISERTRENELAAMSYAEYLQTPEWRELRCKAIEWAQDRCQVCYSTERLEVHHRCYGWRGHESQANLIVLCHHCHELFHLVNWKTELPIEVASP